jgi:hypothetical protein
MARRQSFDAQQEAVPPKRKGRFYREPDNAGKLPGKFYSQQTEVPSGGKGKFYSRSPSDSKVPEGHFFRDRSAAASPPNLDEEGQGPQGEAGNGGIDKGEPATSAELSAFKEKVKKRSAKVRRQRGRL